MYTERFEDGNYTLNCANGLLIGGGGEEGKSCTNKFGGYGRCYIEKIKFRPKAINVNFIHVLKLNIFTKLLLCFCKHHYVTIRLVIIVLNWFWETCSMTG